MATHLMIPRDLEDAIDNELESGERIEWVGMPIPRYFTPAATARFLFGIPWTAFAVFWMCGASGFKVPDFKDGFDLFPLFGIPFVLIGVGMLSSPIWAYRKALKTVYVITDQRAICFDGGRSTTIRSYHPRHLQSIRRKDRRDDSGDVIFGSELVNDADGNPKPKEFGFLNIQHPKDVEERLRKLAARA